MKLALPVVHLSVLANFVSLTAALPKVLIFSRTLGYRHESIPDAISSLKSHGSAANIEFDATEDPTLFTNSNLKGYDAVLFLMTTDSADTPRQEVLTGDQKTALQEYFALGGNYIGVHAASDSMTLTPFFGNETGAYFDYHPALQNATIVVVNASNPSTNSLPGRWPVQDEIYNFKSDPRDLGAEVYLSVDESTYKDTGTRKYNQGTPHPIAWGQEHGAGAFLVPSGNSPPSASAVGRSWYTSLGHLSSTWQDETFMSHIMGGITWALQSGTTLAFNGGASVGNGNATSTSTSITSTSGTIKPTTVGSSSTISSVTTTSTSGAERRVARLWDL